MTTQTAHGTVPELTQGWRLKMALGEMKVQDMADLLGVNRATVGRWMADKGAPPRRAYLLQWALVTGVDAQWLETGNAASQPDGPGGGEEECAHRDSNPEPAGYAHPQVDWLAEVVALPLAGRERELAEAV